MRELSSAADVSLTRLLNRLSFCCLLAASFALIGHSQRAELNSASNSAETDYSSLILWKIHFLAKQFRSFENIAGQLLASWGKRRKPTNTKTAEGRGACDRRPVLGKGDHVLIAYLY
jgi:hypothetical protein